MPKYLKWSDALPEQIAQHVTKVYSNGKGWTTEPPTVEGFYWVYDVKDKTYPAEVVLVYKRDGQMRVGEDYEYSMPAERYGTHFLGPLPAPELPNG
jgi:hypothetical protein